MPTAYQKIYYIFCPVRDNSFVKEFRKKWVVLTAHHNLNYCLFLPSFNAYSIKMIYWKFFPVRDNSLVKKHINKK